MKLPDILNRLTSADREVLRSCEANADTMLSNEKLRGERDRSGLKSMNVAEGEGLMT
jgi:hypothetical protein